MKTLINRGRAGVLRSAMAEQPDPPCVTFRCRLAADCALDLLACEAFASFIEGGLVNHQGPDPQPTGERYDALFARVDEPLPKKNFTLVP